MAVRRCRVAGFGDEHGRGLLAHSQARRRVGAVGKVVLASASLAAAHQIDADVDLT